MREGQYASRVVHFGVFEVDLEAGELRKNGLKIPLQDQPFRMLELLLESPGKVVSREEARLKLWPADTFVEFDRALNTAVNKIREALGDSANNPRFIETLPRRGYRFLGAAERVSEAAAHEEQTRPALEPIRPAAKPKRSRPFVWGAALLIIVAASLAIGWLASRAKEEELHPQLVAVPLTTYPGVETWPTFSPDGNQVAFAWDGPKSDNQDIYVKLIGTENALRLTTDPAWDGYPEWSPDGRHIAFERNLSPGKFGIFLISPIGGPERKLAEVNDDGGLSWSPDGKWLALTDRSSGETKDAISLLSVDTGEKRRLTFPPTVFGDGDPAFSPDGRSLVFNRIFADDVSELYLLSLTDTLRPDGPPKQLTFRHHRSLRPAWTSDGHEILFTAGPASYLGFAELWRVSVFGVRTPRRLEFAGDQGYFPTISRRGNRLAYMRAASDQNIYRLELPGPGRKAVEPVALISSTRDDFTAQYSPNGERIAFTSARSGSPQVWVCNSDGSGAVQLTFLGGTLTGCPRWSPDGTHIVFDSNMEGQAEIYVGDVSGSQPRRLTNPPADAYFASFSKDGCWIYFVSRRTGREEIWKMPAVGGEPVQLTRNGGVFPFESSDRKDLYFATRGSLWRVPVVGGEETEVLTSIDERAWAVVSEGIYFAQANPDGGTSVRFLRFGTGKVKAITTINRRFGCTGGFSLTPDGHYLLYTQQDQSGSDLMLVENFR